MKYVKPLAAILPGWVALLAGLGAVASAAETPAPAGEVRFDFESGQLAPWRVVEGAFENLVSSRETFHNNYAEIPGNRYNKQGRYYLSTVERKSGPSNDSLTGVVESPVFVLEGPEISFLLGGGQAENVYVALCTLSGR